MRVHHLAVRTLDLERSVRFYRDLVGLAEIERMFASDGAVRSVWLALDHGVLMIERAEVGEATPAVGAMDLIAFAIAESEREAFRARFGAAGFMVEAETAHTLYVRDPDGRRVAVSSYPLPLGPRGAR